MLDSTEVYHTEEQQDNYAEKASVLNQIEELETKILKRKKWSYMWGSMFVGSIFFPILNSIFLLDFKIPFWIVSFGFILSICGLIYVLDQDKTDNKTRREFIVKLQVIENLIFSEEISNATQEERAVKQLNKSQLDLDNYYQLNISHVSKIFNLGKTIVLFGTFIIVGTIILMFFKPKMVNDIILICSLIGGALVDFIGAIFISMYSKIIKSANLSQYGMLETTQAYLGNVLASQIQDDKLREDTLSELAKSLIKKEKNINFND
ncbi:hypothetical protein A5816_000752 [Enterococcus sp. 3G1_DIV0629]|nr:hypothetical protein [Enterococcus sp. 3G1_DIV0629]EME8123213.1 hypothetical protein [Enterococcus faecium]OTO28484.1 hypothetical protein A5816_000752 [Enterococcus sp. 3G1_DIV0629]